MRFRRPESGRLAKIPHRPGRMKRGCSRNSSRAKQFFYLPRRTFMATEGYLLRVWRSKHAAVKETIGLLECPSASTCSKAAPAKASKSCSKPTRTKPSSTAKSYKSSNTKGRLSVSQLPVRSFRFAGIYSDGGEGGINGPLLKSPLKAR